MHGSSLVKTLVSYIKAIAGEIESLEQYRAAPRYKTADSPEYAAYRKAARALSTSRKNLAQAEEELIVALCPGADVRPEECDYDNAKAEILVERSEVFLMSKPSSLTPQWCNLLRIIIQSIKLRLANVAFERNEIAWDSVKNAERTHIDARLEFINCSVREQGVVGQIFDRLATYWLAQVISQQADEAVSSFSSSPEQDEAADKAEQELILTTEKFLKFVAEY